MRAIPSTHTYRLVISTRATTLSTCATTLSTRATTLSTRATPSTHTYRLQSYPRVLLHPPILTDYSHIHACYTLSHDVAGHTLVDSRVRELELVRPTQALVVFCDLCTLRQRSTTRQLCVCVCACVCVCVCEGYTSPMQQQYSLIHD